LIKLADTTVGGCETIVYCCLTNVRLDNRRAVERDLAPTPDPDTYLLSIDAGIPVIMPIDKPFLPPNSIFIYT